MNGVKRPFNLGAPKPPKSAKKKKLLKQTQPIPDPDDATVIANPHAEYMVQKPCELMDTTKMQRSFADEQMAPPFTEVMEEGDIPNAEEMVKNLQVKLNGLEQPDKLPHLMRFRYKLLMEKPTPKS